MLLFFLFRIMRSKWPNNNFIMNYYRKQLYNYSDGMFFIIIALIFSDLLNVIISSRTSSNSENGQFSGFNRRSSQNDNYKNNNTDSNKYVQSSETAASSQKSMLQSNFSDDDHIQINDFQSIKSNSTTKSTDTKSEPNELFTVQEARTVEEIPQSTMIINSLRPVQLPRRKSEVFPKSSQIATTRLSICLLSLVLVILILFKIYQIGVLAALIMGLFLRICVKMCNGFCLECSPIEYLDRSVGDKNLCGVGFFPSPRLAAKRRMDKEKMYQEICKREQQGEDCNKDDSIVENQSPGFVSMQIDRNVLYQRFDSFLVFYVN